jgi:hypothetical protein
MIQFESEVIDYLDDLVYKLYDNNYFSFIESAEDYVIKLIDFIQNSIETSPIYKTPKVLQLYGSNYIFYNSNQRTTWYIFFEKEKNNYLITNILNNCSKEANWL